MSKLRKWSKLSLTWGATCQSLS